MSKKPSKPAGAGAKDKPSKPAPKRASKKAAADSAAPTSVQATRDRNINIRKISNGSVVSESYHHKTRGYVTRETFVKGTPKITITGAGAKRELP